MKHKSIIPKNEYQSYKNDFNKEILNETNQPKETMTKEQLKNKVILSMKKDNDLKKYVNVSGNQMKVMIIYQDY